MKLGNIIINSDGVKSIKDSDYVPPPHGGGGCISGKDCYNYNGTCTVGYCNCTSPYTGTYCQLHRPEFAAMGLLHKDHVRNRVAQDDDHEPLKPNTEARVVVQEEEDDDDDEEEKQANEVTVENTAKLSTNPSRTQTKGAAAVRVEKEKEKEREKEREKEKEPESSSKKRQRDSSGAAATDTATVKTTAKATAKTTPETRTETKTENKAFQEVNLNDAGSGGKLEDTDTNNDNENDNNNDNDNDENEGKKKRRKKRKPGAKVPPNSDQKPKVRLGLRVRVKG